MKRIAVVLGLWFALLASTSYAADRNVCVQTSPNTAVCQLRPSPAPTARPTPPSTDTE